MVRDFSGGSTIRKHSKVECVLLKLISSSAIYVAFSVQSTVGSSGDINERKVRKLVELDILLTQDKSLML